MGDTPPDHSWLPPMCSWIHSMPFPTMHCASVGLCLDPGPRAHRLEIAKPGGKGQSGYLFFLLLPQEVTAGWLRPLAVLSTFSCTLSLWVLLTVNSSDLWVMSPLDPGILCHLLVISLYPASTFTSSPCIKFSQTSHFGACYLFPAGTLMINQLITLLNIITSTENGAWYLKAAEN